MTHRGGISWYCVVVALRVRQVSSNTLPQVTWIVGPTALSEHATNHPGDGEDLSHRLINVLAQPENADVYAKSTCAWFGLRLRL